MFQHLTPPSRPVQLHIHCNAHNQINKDGILTVIPTFRQKRLLMIRRKTIQMEYCTEYDGLIL